MLNVPPPSVLREHIGQLHCYRFVWNMFWHSVHWLPEMHMRGKSRNKIVFVETLPLDLPTCDMSND